MSTSIPPSGIITQGELCTLTELPPLQARLLATRHAGQPTSRMRGGRLQLFWPLAPLAGILVQRSIPGLRPGLWCTRSLLDRLFADWPPAARRSILSGSLLRHTIGTSRLGHACRLYALADALAILRRSPEFYLD